MFIVGVCAIHPLILKTKNTCVKLYNLLRSNGITERNQPNAAFLAKYTFAGTTNLAISGAEHISKIPFWPLTGRQSGFSNCN